MTLEPLAAIAQADEDGTVRILSPGVGWWSGPPAPGQPLGPGSRLGTLSRLGRRFGLVLPRQTAQGQVVDPPGDRRIVAVEYGQLLFRLAPMQSAAAGSGPAPSAAGARRGGANPGAGLSIVAPTDGTFYQRPSPEAAPYVEVGQTIRRGQVVGLVEVMKTFNQIVFHEAGEAEEAVVTELRAGDAEEVRAGQTLVVLET